MVKSDRQALVETFETLATNLKSGLDNAPCVQPSRFTTWVRSEGQAQIEPMQPAQLPEG